MYSAWKKIDDPPARVEPVPMMILLCAAALCTDCDRDSATIDCVWMAFYFLLRPGEYANHASGDAKHPFRLCDVQYAIGHLHIFDSHLTTVQQCLAGTLSLSPSPLKRMVSKAKSLLTHQLATQHHAQSVPPFDRWPISSSITLLCPPLFMYISMMMAVPELSPLP